MSSIGFGNIGAMNLAGSLAGAQKTDASTDSAKAEAAGRKFQGDQKSMSAHSLEDVAETELSGDRDADGREPFGARHRPEHAEDELADQLHPHQHGIDVTGEVGGKLDLEA